MKFSTVALFAIGASATPAKAPASKSFIINITVPELGSYYLAKGGKGLGTKNLAEATTCAINAKTELVCDGKYIVGAAYANDMVPLKTNPGQTITTGYTLGPDNKLHWRNTGFSLQKEINRDQGGEAGWALYPKNGGVQLYAQLGCPKEPSEKHAFHNAMVVGTQKLIIQ